MLVFSFKILIPAAAGEFGTLCQLGKARNWLYVAALRGVENSNLVGTLDYFVRLPARALH